MATDAEIILTLNTNAKLHDMKEALVSFRGRVFDTTETLRDSVHEASVWNHIEPRTGDHLVQLHDTLTEALQSLEDAIEALQD